MKTSQIFENEFAIIEADIQAAFIQVTWLQHTSNTDLRDVLLKATEYARANGLTKWLFDLRKLNFTTIADKVWSTNDLFPSFNLEHNHKLACVATPQNVELMAGTVVRTAIEEHPELADKIKFEVFISPESAHQWLFQEEEESDTVS